MAPNNIEELTSRLKSYVPFLQEMIGSLKTDMPQHAKIVALLNMITDTRKKFKYETLKKCEEVILKMQTKTNYKCRISNIPLPTAPESIKPPSFTFTKIIPLSPILNVAKETTINKIDNPRSPDCDEVPTIRSPDPGTWEPPDDQADRYTKETPCIYTKAAESVGKSKSIQPIIPELDISKPPISLSDLETLKNDVLEIMCDKNESQVETKKTQEIIKVQSKVSLVPAPIIKPRSKDKQESSIQDSKANVDSKNKNGFESKNLDNPGSKPSSRVISKNKHFSDDSSSLGNKDKTNKPMSTDTGKMKQEKKETILKDENTIFASLLSSIDDKILTDKKKRRDSKEAVKKEDDRKKDTKPKSSIKPAEIKQIELKKETPSNVSKSNQENCALDNNTSKTKMETTTSGKEGEKVFIRLADKYNPKPKKSTENKTEEAPVNVEILTRDPRITNINKTNLEPFTNASFNYKPFNNLGDRSTEVPKIIPSERFNDQAFHRQQDNFVNNTRSNHLFNNASTFNSFNNENSFCFKDNSSYQENGYGVQRNFQNFCDSQPRFSENTQSQSRLTHVQNDFPRTQTNDCRNQFLDGPRMQFNNNNRFITNDTQLRNYSNNFSANNPNINQRPMQFTNNYPQNFGQSPSFQSPEAKFLNQNFTSQAKNSFNPYDVHNEYDLSAMPPIHYERNNQTSYNDHPKTYKTWREEREMRDPRFRKDNRFERSKSIGKDDIDKNNRKKPERRVSPESEKRTERSKSIDSRLRSKSPPRCKNSYKEKRNSPEKEKFTSPLEQLYSSRKQAEARVIQNFKIPKKQKPSESTSNDSEKIKTDEPDNVDVQKSMEENEITKTGEIKIRNDLQKENIKETNSNLANSEKNKSTRNEDIQDAKNVTSNKKSKDDNLNEMDKISSDTKSSNTIACSKANESDSKIKEEPIKTKPKTKDEENKTKLNNTEKTNDCLKIKDKNIEISDVKIVIEKCQEIRDLEEIQMKKKKLNTEDDITDEDLQEENKEEIFIETKKDPKKINQAKVIEADDTTIENKKYIPKPKSKQNKLKPKSHAMRDTESKASTSQNDNSSDHPPNLIAENLDEDADEKKVLREKKLLDLSKGVDKEDLLEILANLKGKSEMDNKVFGLFGMLVNLVKNETQGESSNLQSSNNTCLNELNNSDENGPPLLQNELNENSDEEDKKDFKNIKRNLRNSRSSVKNNEIGNTGEPIETVGERIKNRKRQKANPTPPKKARRNELDKLHEDIKETLGDDVLTSRRACTLNKNEYENRKNKTADFTNENLCQKAKGLRVVLEKLTDLERPKRRCAVKEEATKRKCAQRSSKTSGFYAESEDLAKPDLEIESNTETEEEIKSNEDKVKNKSLKRKKSSWALGVIKKKKKTSKKDEEQLSDGEQSKTGDEDDVDQEDVESEVEEEEAEYVEPNINYYLKVNTQNKCDLCEFNGKLIIPHYISAHPKREIFISKLPPNETKDAVEESERLKLEDLEPQDETLTQQRKKRFDFDCRFCKIKLNQLSAVAFYDHLSQHTGELRFKCTFCPYKTQSKKNFNYHNQAIHKNEADVLIDPPPINYRYVFGYVCSECNFLQLKRKTICDHIKIYHLGNNVRPIRISMSYTVGEKEPEDHKETKDDKNNEIEKTEIQSAVENVHAENENILEESNTVNEPDNHQEQSNENKPVKNQSKSKQISKKTKKDINSDSFENILDSNRKELSDNSSCSDEESLQKLSEIKLKTLNNKRPRRNTAWSPKKKNLAKNNVPKNDDEDKNLDGSKLDALSGAKTVDSSTEILHEDTSKTPDFTAFLGGKDIIEEELNLEQIRLDKMKEIEESLKHNKILSKRTSFVNELKSRLDTETKEKSPEPALENTPCLLKPKIELPDYTEESYETYENIEAPNLNKDIVNESNQTVEETSHLNKRSEETNSTIQTPTVLTTLIQPSAIKQEMPGSPPPLVDCAPKENPFSNIVCRLQEQLSEKTPPRIEVLHNGDKMYSVGVIEAKVTPSGLTVYYCKLPDCIFNTGIKNVFESHCKLTHKNERLLLNCRICVREPDQKSGIHEMINIFKHLQDHVEEENSKTVENGPLEGSIESPEQVPALTIKITNVTSLANKKNNTLPPLVPIARSTEQRFILINSTQNQTITTQPLVLNHLLTTTASLNTTLACTKKFQSSGPMVTCKVVPMAKEETDIPRKHQDILKKWLDPIILQRLLKCPVYNCEFTTESEEEFDFHIDSHDATFIMACLYCNFKMKKMFIKVHYMMRHAKSNYGCPYCLYRAVCSDYIQIHQELNHKYKPIKALNFPQDIFSTIYRSPSPPSIRHIMKPFICSCQKKFFAINNFEDHVNNEKHFNCSLCKTVFLKSSSLIQHFQLHQVYAYNCRYCTFAAQTPELILNHIATEHSYQKVNIIWRYLKNGEAREEDDECFEHFIVISRSNGDEGTIEIPNKVLNPNLSQNSESSTVHSNIIVLEDDEPEEITKVIIKTEVESSKDSTPETSNKIPNNPDNKSNNHSDSIEDESVDGNGYEESNVPMKSNFSGCDLYKCYSCKTSFSDSNDFKAHLNVCKLIEDKVKPFGCIHCNKWFKNNISLLDHIRVHGVPRITCSLCNTKYAHPWHARYHMKTKHNINNCSVIAVDPKNSNSDLEEFIVKQTKYVRRTNTEKCEKLTIVTDSVTAEETNKSGPKNSYSPEEMHLLPVNPIFGNFVYCSICNFGTKVRTNLVRHMQLHKNNEDAVIPDSCPVNPVPCLEKNELMFDKMTNLANSSYSRMGGKDSLKTKEDEINYKVPAYVPSNKRYVCGANSCNYLCLEESMLRHHLQALHWHESVYVCSHCQENLCLGKFTLNIDEIINHVRLHEGMLYGCGHCKYFHNLRTKVEKHSTNKHSDKSVKVVTIREESEPGDNEREKRHKSWRCGMCKARYVTKSEAKAHVQSKHGLDYQYKCNHCNFICSDKNNYSSHYSLHHNGLVDDVVVTFYHEDDKDKEKEKKSTEIQHDNFDTTPLWVKNKNNVKHIRGILIEEQEKVSKRSPIKIGPIITPEKKIPNTEKKSEKRMSLDTKKNVVDNKLDKVVTSNKKSNLDFCIEAVATGNETCAFLRPVEVGQSRRGRKRKNQEQHQETFEFVNIISNEESPPILFKAEPEQNETVLDLEDTLSVRTPPNKEPATTIYNPTKTDLQTMPVEKLIGNNFIGLYGPFGKPYENMFQCPLCAVYQTKEIMVFEIHLLEELDYKRFSCDICQHKAITYAQMRLHYNDSHGSLQPDNISCMLRDEQKDLWIQNAMVLQERLIKHFVSKDNIEDNTANFFNRSDNINNIKSTYENEDTLINNDMDTEEMSVDMNSFGCPLCKYKAKYSSTLQEHIARRHTFKKPYKCPHCIYASIRKSDCMKHVRNIHKGMPEHVIFNKDDLFDLSNSKTTSPSKQSDKKQTARKSTCVVSRLHKQTARKSTGTPRKNETPYSYYGQPPDITEHEIKTITTTVPVMNNSVTMTVGQLQKIFNIFPQVKIVDIEKPQL